MPSRYIVRNFEENGFYHIFNRGIEKRETFTDKQDYQIFKYYMFVYLAPLNKVLSRHPDIPIRLHGKNLNEELDLIAYCLMPSHFHFLIRLKTKDAISRFMKQLINAYTFYFNKKYQRAGNLLQGRFKSVKIPTDEILLHVSRYIHLNPVMAKLTDKPENYPWSSYNDFLNNKLKETFIQKQLVLEHFQNLRSYGNFVSDQVDYAKTIDKIKHLTIE